MDLRIILICCFLLGNIFNNDCLAKKKKKVQNKEQTELTSLVTSIVGEEKNKRDSVIIDWGDDPYIYNSLNVKEKGNVKENGDVKESDALESDVIDVLSFLAETPVENSGRVDDSSNHMRGSKEKSPSFETSSYMVFDYMTKAYNNHDFYQEGHWDDAEDYSSIINNITLPEYNPADFYRPVTGRVTSIYGYRPSFGRMHRGIDLALNVGDTVCAALPGVVAKIGYDPFGYGHYVVVVHNNGMETRYAHLQSAMSAPGDRLNAGDPLGLGGNSGNSTGPHLHFEIRYRGVALDPSTIFNFYRRGVKELAHTGK